MPRPAAKKPVEAEAEIPADEVEPEEAPEEDATEGAATDEDATEEAPEEDAPRTETFEATRPDGEVVVVERNIDTGVQKVTSK